MVDSEPQGFVLIQRREDNTLIRGVVAGTDNQKGKVIVRGLPPTGGEFLSPVTLLENGVAQSRSGHIRFFTLPLTEEATLILGDNQQV